MTAGRRPLGFVVRIGLVVLYGGLAFFLADRVGQSREPTAPEPPSRSDHTVQGTALLRIQLQASRPVDDWNIRLDGRPLSPAATSALNWSGETSVPSAAGGRLVFAIDSTPAAGEAPLAVRLEIVGDQVRIDRTFWADSSLVEAVDLDPLPAEGSSNR